MSADETNHRAHPSDVCCVRGVCRFVARRQHKPLMVVRDSSFQGAAEPQALIDQSDDQLVGQQARPDRSDMVERLVGRQAVLNEHADRQGRAPALPGETMDQQPVGLDQIGGEGENLIDVIHLRMNVAVERRGDIMEIDPQMPTDTGQRRHIGDCADHMRRRELRQCRVEIGIAADFQSKHDLRFRDMRCTI